MNERLEIAARVLAAYRGFDREHANAPSEALAQWALRDADALIAAELATRANSACAHFWSARAIVDGRFVQGCLRCGSIEETCP